MGVEKVPVSTEAPDEKKDSSPTEKRAFSPRGKSSDSDGDGKGRQSLSPERNRSPAVEGLKETV